MAVEAIKTAGLMTIVKDNTPAFEPESVACIEKLNVPAAEAVPPSNPAEDRDNPVGKLPEATRNV